MESPLQLSHCPEVRLKEKVSILVLVESPLQSSGRGFRDEDEVSFNPCFSGISSSIPAGELRKYYTLFVSILVLVESPLQ